ncbi:AMP-binding enzyme [Rhodobacter capsulatus]|nr:hypothetical protein AP071_16565 [Rhodobacter capsulatus]KQB14382.1 hypothetical protein AP073_15385 [Rhodobacter capsulatus]PZX23341.1 AMP-binding enzyme [Rhodobacter capsulatus]
MITPSEDLRKDLVKWGRTEIGPIASPDLIQWAPGLPKTRSGKIMRRILRKIAENDYGALGDISTLADPGVTESGGLRPPPDLCPSCNAALSPWRKYPTGVRGCETPVAPTGSRPTAGKTRRLNA